MAVFFSLGFERAEILDEDGSRATPKTIFKPVYRLLNEEETFGMLEGTSGPEHTSGQSLSQSFPF
jgi:hypothetical protein